METPPVLRNADGSIKLEFNDELPSPPEFSTLVRNLGFDPAHYSIEGDAGVRHADTGRVKSNLVLKPVRLSPEIALLDEKNSKRPRFRV
jgi:hypothetical protein